MRRLLLISAVLLMAACGAHAPAPAPDLVSAPRPPDTPADKQAAFARAYEAFRAGDEQRALPVFLALADGYPELADYALYFAGTIAARRGDAATATAAFTRLLRDYPDSVNARPAALELGNLLLRGDRIEQARPLLHSALLAADKATVEAARLALAEADEREGNIYAAAAGYMEVRRALPGSAVGRSAKQHILALRAQHAELMPAGAGLLAEARLLLAERDYAAAYRAAQELLRHGEVEPAEALRVEADALYGHGDVEEGLATLRTLVDRYPTSTAAPEALFRLASVLWNRDRDEAALVAFEEFGRRYSDGRHAPDALYAIGRIHESAGRDDLALRSFGILAQRYPRSGVADEARWRIGWIRYRAAQWSAAADALSQCATETTSPRLRNEATYWKARALERAGHAESAQRLYRDVIDRDPADYYAMWAEQHLGLASSESLAAWQTEPVTPAALAEVGGGLPVLQPATSVDAFHFSRWGELKAAGVYALARKELAAIDRGHRDDPVTLRALLGAYLDVEGLAAVQHRLRRLGAGAGLSDFERQRLLYPLAFWSIVSREARDNSVDPLLVEALIRQESLFDPEAKSPANAYGLMQLLPDTAARLALGGNTAVDPLALLQPDLNVDLGTRHLANLLARFDGDMLKALAAYNGGEAAVEKWQRRFADLEPDEFVESISYRETRDYVKRVVGNYRAYRQLYAPRTT
jgi:soluble lytic murein transglycosylase